MLAQLANRRFSERVMCVVTTRNTPSFTDWFRGEILKQG
jgi:hypothetical protein